MSDDHSRPKGIRVLWKRLTILGLSCVFLLLGLIGILLPVIPGMVFLITGMYLLSLESLWLSNRLEVIGQKYPKFAKVNKFARGKALQIINNICSERQ